MLELVAALLVQVVPAASLVAEALSAVDFLLQPLCQPQVLGIVVAACRSVQLLADLWAVLPAATLLEPRRRRSQKAMGVGAAPNKITLS